MLFDSSVPRVNVSKDFNFVVFLHNFLSIVVIAYVHVWQLLMY